MHFGQLAAHASCCMLPIGRQRLELLGREVETVHHALLDHVDNHLEACVPEATMQEIKELHVRIVGHGQDGVRFNCRCLPV
jgi:hypothetical protein